MAVEARTFPDEIQKSFGDLQAPAVDFLKTLAVKFEPFGVPLNNNPNENDLRGFEMLAYGPGGASYGQLVGQAKRAGVEEAILGTALFKVAFLSAEAVTEAMKDLVQGRVLEGFVFTFNIDAPMLMERRLENIVTQLRKPSFSVFLEASENLRPAHVEPLVRLLQKRDSWLKLALDDANDLPAGTRRGLMDRIELVKADGKYVRKLYDDETYLPGTMLPALQNLRQDRKSFVAEGIESADMKNFLVDRWDVSAHGELWMQGYHIRVPKPWSDVLCPLNPDPELPKAYVLPEVPVQGGVSALATTSDPTVGKGGAIHRIEAVSVAPVDEVNPIANPNQQVADWLAHPEARPFLHAQVADIRRRFNVTIGDDDAAAVVECFANFPLTRVKGCFWSVLSAVEAIPGQTAPEPVRQAIIGLFTLVAVRLVNRSVGQIKEGSQARKVASAEPNLCAVVVNAMIGGELCYKRDDNAGKWVPRYIFHIHLPVAGDDWHNAFLRQVFQQVAEGVADHGRMARPPDAKAGNVVQDARNDQALSEEEWAWLKITLGKLSKVFKLTVGLVAHPTELEDKLLASVAKDLEVPILKIDNNLRDGILELSAADLVAYFDQLWASLDPSSVREATVPAVAASQDQAKVLGPDLPKPSAGTARPLAATLQEAGKTAAATREIASLFTKLYNTVAPAIGLPPLP